MNDSDRLIFVATSDVAGITRGKAFPAAELASRRLKGVGWTPTNVMINCFDGIAEGPFGSLGDLALVPDGDAGFTAGDGEGRVIIGDIRELDGTPWSCCTRSILKAALSRLADVAGLQMIAAFEHEFQFRTNLMGPGRAYGFRGYAPRRAFGEALSSALRSAGITPDTFMKEYGPDQYEVTVEPAPALRACDEALILRELTRLCANEMGEEVTFTPIRDPASVGNGVHIHLSLQNRQGRPVTWSADGRNGLSDVAGAFCAGILTRLPEIVAMTAPSDISYLRLTPHRWSAAFNNLGYRDREASLRICPYTATEPEAISRQFNFEYRAADAAASPYLAMAALVHAGIDGIEAAMPTPEVTTDDLSLLSSDELAARGIERLPQSLDTALGRFAESAHVTRWFGKTFCEVYVAHKRGELAALEGKTIEARCTAYEAVF